jgi:hypothetical protein
MYGKETAGVVCGNAETFAAAVGCACCACERSDDADEIISEVYRCHSDNMGLQLIFY